MIRGAGHFHAYLGAWMGRTWRQAWAVVPFAVLAVGALVLPWALASGTVLVVDGPDVTGVAVGSGSAFAVLAGWKWVAVLATALFAVVVAFVRREAALWAAGLAGAVALVVATGALSARGGSAGPVALCVAALLLLLAVAYELVSRQSYAALVLLALALPVLVMTGGWGIATSTSDGQIAEGDFPASARLVPVGDTVAVADGRVVRVFEGGELVERVRVEDPHVTVLGIVGDRLVYYRADALEVRVEPPGAVVTGVVGVDSMTADGKLLLRSAGVSTPTLHRLHVTTATGRTHAENLQRVRVPAIRPLLETDDPDLPMRFHEHPKNSQVVTVDNTELDQGVLVGAYPADDRWQRLTGSLYRDCAGSAPRGDLGDVDAMAPDRMDGWWLHVRGQDGVLHFAGGSDGTTRTVGTSGYLPVDAAPIQLSASLDGTLHVLLPDGLWRLPTVFGRPEGAPAPKPAECVPSPAVAGPVRLEPTGDQYVPRVVPDGYGGTWRLLAGEAIVHTNAQGQEVGRHPTPAGTALGVDLTGGVPFVGSCPPARIVDGRPVPPAVVAGGDCWDDVVVGRDGRGWAAVGGRLCSFGPAGVAQLTAGAAEDHWEPVANQLARGVPPAAVPFRQPSLALDRDGRLLVQVEDMLFGLSDQGQLIVLGQDDRLRNGRLVTTGDGALVRMASGALHRLGY